MALTPYGVRGRRARLWRRLVAGFPLTGQRSRRPAFGRGTAPRALFPGGLEPGPYAPATISRPPSFVPARPVPGRRALGDQVVRHLALVRIPHGEAADDELLVR